MVCDVCGKKAATVHLTEIIDEQMNELHLCEDCARQKSADMEQQFGLSDLLGGLAEFEKINLEKETSTLKCAKCGLAYADFKKIGRLGCAECYSTFKKYLSTLLKRIHGSSIHFGKSPVKTASKPQKKRIDLQELRAKLQKAIETEAFEDAALLRDQIKEVEQKQQLETDKADDADT